MPTGPTWQYKKEDITSDAQDVLRELILKTYSDPKLFVRELVQNAAGAGATEVHFSMTVAKDDPSRVVWLTVQDNGHGMDQADIRAYLSCLGRSDNPLGQFGVGFFSSLATSDYVEICSHKAGFQPVRAAYWRDYDDVGTTIIEHGLGSLDGETLAAFGLESSTGTVVKIKFPYYGKRNRQEAQTDISSAIDQWCKYLDLKIFLGGQTLKSGVELPSRAKIKFDENVTYLDPLTNAVQTCRMSGALGVSDKNDVKLLKNFIVIQAVNLTHGGTYVYRIEGFINCDVFEVAPARTSVINNSGQASGAIMAAVMDQATHLVERLFEELILLPDWSQSEATFVKERIWGYYKESGNAGLPTDRKLTRGIGNLIQNPDLMTRVKWLKSIAGPGNVDDLAVGKELTIFDLWQVLQNGKRILWAPRLEQIVEDLAKDGNVVIPQGSSGDELLKALVGITPGASIESAEQQERPDRFKAIGEVSADQTAFLAICKMLDPAVILVEPIAPDDPRTIFVQGYYSAGASNKPAEIGINVINPFIAEVIAQSSADPIMAGIRIFHTIMHERNHERFSAHDDAFLRGLEPLLDARIGPWLDRLREVFIGVRCPAQT